MSKFLKLSGKDSFSFLQRQASNDIKGEGAFTAFLNSKAELISLARITHSSENEFSIFCKNAGSLKSHLEKFAIIEELNFELNDGTSNDEQDLDDFEEGESLIKQAEAHPEKRLLEKYVSFTKGCFPGQEVLSKYKNIGLKKKEERSKKYTDEALEIFAKAQNNSTELDPAIDLLKKALKENPKNEDAYESLGVMLAKQEKYQEAIQVMQTLEVINPQNQMAQMNLSIFYMKIGDKEKAEEHKAKGTVLQFEEALK